MNNDVFTLVIKPGDNFDAVQLAILNLETSEQLDLSILILEKEKSVAFWESDKAETIPEQIPVTKMVTLKFVQANSYTQQSYRFAIAARPVKLMTGGSFEPVNWNISAVNYRYEQLFSKESLKTFATPLKPIIQNLYNTLWLKIKRGVDWSQIVQTPAGKELHDFAAFVQKLTRPFDTEEAYNLTIGEALEIIAAFVAQPNLAESQLADSVEKKNAMVSTGSEFIAKVMGSIYDSVLENMDDLSMKRTGVELENGELQCTITYEIRPMDSTFVLYSGLGTELEFAPKRHCADEIYAGDSLRVDLFFYHLKLRDQHDSFNCDVEGIISGKEFITIEQYLDGKLWKATSMCGIPENSSFQAETNHVKIFYDQRRNASDDDLDDLQYGYVINVVAYGAEELNRTVNFEVEFEQKMEGISNETDIGSRIENLWKEIIIDESLLNQVPVWYLDVNSSDNNLTADEIADTTNIKFDIGEGSELDILQLRYLMYSLIRQELLAGIAIFTDETIESPEIGFLMLNMPNVDYDQNLTEFLEQIKLNEFGFPDIDITGSVATAIWPGVEMFVDVDECDEVLPLLSAGETCNAGMDAVSNCVNTLGSFTCKGTVLKNQSTQNSAGILADVKQDNEDESAEGNVARASGSGLALSVIAGTLLLALIVLIVGYCVYKKKYLALNYKVGASRARRGGSGGSGSGGRSGSGGSGSNRNSTTSQRRSSGAPSTRRSNSNQSRPRSQQGRV